MFEPRGRVDKELIVKMSQGYFSGRIRVVGNVFFSAVSLKMFQGCLKTHFSNF